MCSIQKARLDDIDTLFPPRTKVESFNQMKEAMFKGTYPGWQEHRGLDNKGQQRQPHPLVDKDGVLVRTTSQKAATALGRHFLVAFYDELKHVDLHRTVSVVCFCALMSIQVGCIFAVLIMMV
jgi:hypothetical protein